MKSFPAMVDMKSEKPADYGIVAPAVSDMPDYDYGLNLSLNKESLSKLGLEDEVTVGGYVHIHAFARVTSLSQEPGSASPDRVCMVLTHIAAEDESTEGEEDEAA